MRSFFVANIRITNPDIYVRYLEQCDEVFAKFKGKYLVVDENAEVLEGRWNYTKLVIIEFPDKQELKNWYESKEYQDILKYRMDGAECDTVIARECCF